MSIAESTEARGAEAGLPPDNVIFGQSKLMQLLRQRVERVAPANVPVLVQGESGTGKEILAKLIHFWSPRRTQPFLNVTCPAIPGTLLESELFGYEKGAFTGANTSKPGRVELAHGGTLFLDEISELDLALQAKLLHLLQDGEFSRIGAQENRRVDVRLICATNRELDEQILAGAFRQDLFYRINVVSLWLPPLRERSSDIPGLVTHLIDRYNQQYNGRAKPISPDLMQALERQAWPGNIRQLENLIKRYVVLGSEEEVASELGSFNRSSGHDSSGDGAIPLKGLAREAAQAVERKIILEALRAHRWNRKQAAQALNISYRSLLYKLRKVGQFPEDERTDA